jgi:DNA-binding transcriptional ArsR family regulator
MDHANLSQSLISHHLADLRQADIVQDEKRGREVFYRLTPRGTAVMELLIKISSKDNV